MLLEGLPGDVGVVCRHPAGLTWVDEPIDWKGNPATFIVGIAGAGNDHLTVLQALAGAFADGASIAALHAARSPDDVLAVLAEKLSPADTGGGDPDRHFVATGASAGCGSGSSCVSGHRRADLMVRRASPPTTSRGSLGGVQLVDQAVQPAVTVTGTPLSAALPDTSSSSGSVRSLIETPATSRLRLISTPSRACP